MNSYDEYTAEDVLLTPPYLLTNDAGSSSVNESFITGESVPVDKIPGDSVIGGTINQHGALTIIATKVGADSMLQQIVKLIEDAQSSKAPIQAYADKISAYFVPVVVAIAILSFIVWLVLVYTVLPDDYRPHGVGRFEFSLLFFVTTMVIACPCALGLATPTAVMVGTGLGAKNSVLIKGGAVLEKCHGVKAIIFDKTGTLTLGRPVVTDIIPLRSSDHAAPAEGDNAAAKAGEIALLQVVGRAESGSEHPIAQAICDHASKVLGW